MCDRIVVFDAPLRLVGRLVDVDIQAAGAWSLAGDVADGLADAVPLEHLFSDGAAAASPTLYDIDLMKSTPTTSDRGRPSPFEKSDMPPADTAEGA
jgi:hypothetical protein